MRLPPVKFTASRLVRRVEVCVLTGWDLLRSECWLGLTGWRMITSRFLVLILVTSPGDLTQDQRHLAGVVSR